MKENLWKDLKIPMEIYQIRDSNLSVDKYIQLLR